MHLVAGRCAGRDRDSRQFRDLAATLPITLRRLYGMMDNILG